MLRRSKENSVSRPSVTAFADSVRGRISAAGGAVSDEDVLRMCEDTVFSADMPGCPGASEKSQLIRAVFCTLRRELEILQDLADDPDVTEIMVNGPGSVFYERNGMQEKSAICFEDRQQLERVIQRLAARVGREINDLNPIVDARLSDGSRINAVNSNIALGGPILTIRKFTRNRMTMEDLIRQRDISRDAAELLKLLVESGYNIFVSGGTSSGKTTFLNVLSDYIPAHERLIVIEDSAELQIRGHDNLVRMESKAANAQGKGRIAIRDLIRASLRMRPDRVIVGEIRGEEVIDMIAAMSTGHDGSLSTGHANSPRGMLRRLESLYISGMPVSLEAVRGQIAEAIDLIVHLERSEEGRRSVAEISEIEGIEGGEIKLNCLYIRRPGKGLLRTGSRISNRDKLERRFGGDDRLQHI